MDPDSARAERKSSLSGLPQRIQLRRTKGWRLPPHTVKVDRTSKWGNRYKVGEVRMAMNGARVTVRDNAHAAELHRAWAESWYRRYPQDIAELRGQNLACWCKPGEPCHADVLLEIANS